MKYVIQRAHKNDKENGRSIENRSKSKKKKKLDSSAITQDSRIRFVLHAI